MPRESAAPRATGAMVAYRFMPAECFVPMLDSGHTVPLPSGHRSSPAGPFEVQMIAEHHMDRLREVIPHARGGPLHFAVIRPDSIVCNRLCDLSEIYFDHAGNRTSEGTRLMFIDVYLALCTAIGAGTATELAVPGYARQPIAFAEPESGICFSTIPYSSGMGVRGAVGRAIYDVPAGGNLLVTLPFAMPIAPGRLLWDTGDRGLLRLSFTRCRTSREAGHIPAASWRARWRGSVPICYVVNANDIGQMPGFMKPLITTVTMTAGVALSVSRGAFAGVGRGSGGDGVMLRYLPRVFMQGAWMAGISVVISASDNTADKGVGRGV